MADNQSDPNEYKIIGALFAIFLYILLTALLHVLNDFSGFIIYFSFVIFLLCVDYDRKNLLEPKEILLGLLWVGILFAWWFLFPDSTLTVYFLLLAVAFSEYMDPKNIVLFLGTTILTIIVFGASFIGFVVLVTLVFFIRSALEDATIGAFMMIPLLIVGWFIGSGWAYTVEQKVVSVSTKVSAETGISTETVENSLTSAFNSTWLLLTNPNAWYEKQFVEKGNRDVGETSKALEITKIEAMPSSVQAKDTFDIIFEMENKGKRTATNVKIGAKADTLADACGKINGKICNPDCPGSTALADCTIDEPLAPIAPLEKRFDSFTFQAPDCPGTYVVEAGVIYDYSAEATLNLQMISRSDYDDLLRNDKMKWVDELSTASSGPYKMTLRTDRQQPIPTTEAATEAGKKIPQVFKIYLGLVNEHIGTAKVSSATLKIPETLELVSYQDNAGKLDIDESCSITYNAMMMPAECDKLVPSGEKCTNKNAANIYLSDVNNEKLSVGEYEAVSDAFREKANARKENGYLPYRIVYAEREQKMEQNDWRYYKCGFRVREEEMDKIGQTQTLFIRSAIDYTFTYSKPTTITVRSATGATPARCDKTMSEVSAISSAQTKPQTRDAIVSELAKQMFYCYNKNDGYIIDETNLCGIFKVDIEECKDSAITSDNIMATLKDERYKEIVGDSFQNILVKQPDGNITDLRTEGKKVFDDRSIYSISMEYIAKYYTPTIFSAIPVIGPAVELINLLSTKNTLLITIDSVTPDTACPITPPSA